MISRIFRIISPSFHFGPKSPGSGTGGGQGYIEHYPHAVGFESAGKSPWHQFRSQQSNLCLLVEIRGAELPSSMLSRRLETMEVHFILEPDQEAFVRKGIASGRYRTAEDAVRDAMAHWERDERARVELLAAFDESEGDLEAGRYADYTDETLPQLADELKREAREQSLPPRL
jgi:Arc/MetJ-type ribon-helix-helix transcriptional regulator